MRKLLNTKPKQYSGYSIPEVVIGAIIIFTTMSVSARLWDSTQTGVTIASQRAKLDSAIRTRVEEIRHCAFFYGLENSAILNTNIANTNCRDYRLNPNAEIVYQQSILTAECGSLGDAFQDHLENQGAQPSDLLADFNLTDYDSTANATTITVSASAAAAPFENMLDVTFSAPIGSDTFEKLTSFTPNVLSSCP